MKKILSPLLMLILMSCNQKKTSERETSTDTIPLTEVVADTTTASVSEDTPLDPIASIRQKVESINNSKELEKKQYQFKCDEMMTVDYFYRNNEIVKIAVDFGTVGDVYAKEGYYYDRGKLIFIYEFVEGGPACEGCIKKNEYRAYVVDDKTVKYLKDQTEADCKKCAFKASSREYKLLDAKNEAEISKLFCK